MKSSQYFFNSTVWKYTEPLIQAYDGLLSDFEKLSGDDYVPANTGYNNTYIKSNNWHFFPFITKSNYYQTNIDRCGTVKNLLDTMPIYDNCMFSIVNPGGVIPPHRGFSDQHLRIHLGLKTDGAAWIRVGNQVQHWEEKKVIVINDWEEHEVSNTSSDPRVIFLFDIKRKDYFDNIIA
jgi:beta-hydroxylase